MRSMKESKLVNDAVELRQFFTKSNFGIDEIMMIYLNTPVSDYFVHDASLGGYVSHKRHFKRKNYFI